jgi:hypothetical protein
VAALLTLITYLVVAVVAIGYACAAGVPVPRRALAAGLALALAVGAGQLLASADTAAAYAMGPPCVLLLGLIMTVPRRRPARREPAAEPGGAASAPAPAAAPLATATPLIPRQFDRRATRPSPKLPVLTDPWAALYASMATQGGLGDTTAAVNRAEHAEPGPRPITGEQAASGEGASTGERVAAADRRRRARQGLPRSLRRSSRCRYR